MPASSTMLATFLPTVALLLLANTPETSGLNVWLDRSTLAGVFDWMQFIMSRKPHKANRCRPKRSSPFHRALTQPTYPLVENGTALLYPTVDFVSARGIALAFNVNKIRFNWSSAAGSYEESQVYYRLIRLKSHNTTVLETPMLSITTQGYVPAMQGAGFFIELQCTNLISGITGFEMHMTFYWPLLANRRMIVMQRHFKKACLSMADKRRQARKCHCRSECRRQRKKNRLRHQRRRYRKCQKRCQKRCRKSPSSCGISRSPFWH
ncbi:hypothetical protein BOX15_Mlig030313g1 [Macrostomum lignano]|uniref:Uncharacterized protein n=2 Tax=Macrostomum lignano TaxID=282301 RepID=A0A267FDC2_9PLAT|nr:hypothetical protein BOX15_Mlig030313g1 [Macrostomum lignano]